MKPADTPHETGSAAGAGRSGEAQRLRAFWNTRYEEFSLKESGIKSMSVEYSDLLYRCKRAAYLKALRLAGLERRIGIRILDAGCGQGFFADVADSIFESPDYTGLDISEKVIAHLAHGMPGQRWICGDLCDPALPLDGGYDLCQSIEVLHLILDDANHTEAIHRLARELRPGGALLVTDTLPATRYQPNDYIAFRPLSYYSSLFAGAELELQHAFPMYYWLPDQGGLWWPAPRVCARLPPKVIYGFDRLALALRLPQVKPSHDSQMRMMVLRKRPAGTARP
jgi:SAM-dependent methyltransferase